MASSILIRSAYEYIRNQIKRGEFMPGALLSENELAEKLNMSRTPIRAAISRLEHEGLVVTLKNRGLLVKEMSIREAMDILEILNVFQMHALSQLEEQDELPDLAKLKGHLDEQYAAKERDDYERYVTNAMAFMQTLLGTLNNQAMLQMIEKHIEKLVHYSTINYKITPHLPHYSANRMNQSIYDGLAAKDYEGVRQIIRTAYEYNRERVIKHGRI